MRNKQRIRPWALALVPATAMLVGMHAPAPGDVPGELDTTSTKTQLSGDGTGAIAGVLLSPRTRLIIEYNRTELA